MTNIVVGFPMVNAGNLYVNGLGISPGTTNLLVNMAAGAARDATNQDDIVLLSPVIINSAVNGANGLDTGTLAVSSTYYVYVIGDSLAANPETNIATQVSAAVGLGGTNLNGISIAEVVGTTPPSSVNNNYQPAGLLSLSSTSPTLPVGYDMFRLVGTVVTDGAAHILPFNSAGSSRLFTYATPIAVLTGGTSATFAAINLTSAVPASAGNSSGFIQVILDVLLTPTGAGNTVAFRPTGSTSATGNVIVSGGVAGVVQETQVTVMASVIAGVVSIDYKVTGSVTVNVVGFINQV